MRQHFEFVDTLSVENVFTMFVFQRLWVVKSSKTQAVS